MQPNTSQASRIRAAADLVQSLAVERVELRRYDHDPGFFGTFQFEFAKGHRRVRLTWDGRERVLKFEVATLQNMNQKVEWQVVEEIRHETSEEALGTLQLLALSHFR